MIQLSVDEESALMDLLEQYEEEELRRQEREAWELESRSTEARLDGV